MEIFSTFTKVDGLYLNGVRILGKYSLNEVLKRDVVPVGKLYSHKEPYHNLISCQLHPKQTRIPTMWGSSIMPSASDK